MLLASQWPSKCSGDNIRIRHININRHVNKTKFSCNKKNLEIFRFLLKNKNGKMSHSLETPISIGGLKKLLGIYDSAFPRKDPKVKLTDLKNSWITDGLGKSPQKVETLWKGSEKQAYKNLFQNIKNNFNLLNNSEIIYYFQNSVEKAWKIMKKNPVGKIKVKNTYISSMSVGGWQ